MAFVPLLHQLRCAARAARHDVQTRLVDKACSSVSPPWRRLHNYRWHRHHLAGQPAMEQPENDARRARTGTHPPISTLPYSMAGVGEWPWSERPFMGQAWASMWHLCVGQLIHLSLLKLDHFIPLAALGDPWSSQPTARSGPGDSSDRQGNRNWSHGERGCR